VKRAIEIMISIIFVIIIFPLGLIVSLVIFIDVKDNPFHFSKRVGMNNKLFNMPKFRTMRQDTPQVATDLLNEKKYITQSGKFLRKYSIDELPQFLSVIKGDMSIIGPRPALFNQSELIKKRNLKGIDKLKPGITGWAQINGRDKISVDEKVKLDQYYLMNKSIILDLKIIFLTIFNVVLKRNISH
tara:strand:+ start:7040 stop:7597 length:558 start_codon:yes stop_codon:yes gene_type:complete